MAKWGHCWTGSKAVGNLVDCSKPRADIGDVGWGGEAADAVEELIGGSGPRGSQAEAYKVDFQLSKLKLGRVQDDAMACCPVKEAAGAKELSLNRVVIEEGVVNTAPAPFKVREQGVHPVCEAVSTGLEALGGCEVAIPAPWGDECSEVPVFLCGKGQGVVPVPVVQDGPPCLFRH